jgi:hypothetical protein
MKFQKRIVRPGTYSVRRKDGTRTRYHISKKRMQHWVNQFETMKSRTLKIPAPWRHEEKAQPIRLDADVKDIDSYNNGGFWEKLWIGPDGWLWGEVDVPRAEDADRLGKTVVDVSLLAKQEWEDAQQNKYPDAITHIALVTHPVVPDDQTFKAIKDEDKPDYVPPTMEPAIALSMEDFAFADDNDAGTDPPKDKANAGGEGASDSATVKDICSLLKEVLQLTLPDDTTADNLLSRLHTALVAVRGKKDEGDESGSVKEPPPGAKEEQGTVAMSQEIAFALETMQRTPTNPATKKPWTAAELASAFKASQKPTEVALSNEQQALLNFGRKTAIKGYHERLQKCVSTGRMTAKKATDLAKKYLTPDMAFSFDAEGNQIPSVFDELLSEYEQIPAGATLTGHRPLEVRKSRSKAGDLEFSWSGVTEEEGPRFDDDSVSDENAADLALQQLATSGYGPKKSK